MVNVVAETRETVTAVVTTTHAIPSDAVIMTLEMLTARSVPDVAQQTDSLTVAKDQAQLTAVAL